MLVIIPAGTEIKIMERESSSRLESKVLWLTNTGGFIKENLVLLSRWKPIKNGTTYYMPEGGELHEFLYIPNLLNLKKQTGTIKVGLVKSDEDTGIWFIPPDIIQLGKPKKTKTGSYIIDFRHMKLRFNIDSPVSIKLIGIGNKNIRHKKGEL